MSKIKRKVNFDVCTVCNHKCTFCSNPDPRTVKHKTTYDDFVSVMENLTNAIDISELGLSAKGEVLINKKLPEMIRVSKERFSIPYVYFSTNGAMLNEYLAVKILEAGIDSIKFSINALDAQTYSQVHLVDEFSIVVENFKRLLFLKKNRFPNVRIMISSVINVEQSDLEKAFAELLGEDVALVDCIQAYKITYTPKFTSAIIEQKITQKCPLPFTDLYINSDGSLGLCCKDYFDAVNFGSLLTHDFDELYSSPSFEEVRLMHQTSTFPDGHLCKSCLLYGMQG